MKYLGSVKVKIGFLFFIHSVGIDLKRARSRIHGAAQKPKIFNAVHALVAAELK